MEELIKKLQELLTKKKKPYVETIMKELGIQEYEVYGLVAYMKQHGACIDIIGNQLIKIQPTKENEIYKIPNKQEHIKLLLLSDTHLASKFDRVDILRYLYEKAEDKQINYILHSGDLTEGLSGRPQQLYELREASYTSQRDYTVEKYPISNIPTFIIAGNHDLWWVKQCGADIVKDICKQREDLIYLGSDCEDLQIGKLSVRMRHGTGGGAYAKSYKLQKYLDSIPSEELPHILQTGHTHQAFYLKQGKTHCFQTSCLQDLTPYERSQGFNNDKSCWWLDITMDNKGNPIQITQELETFGQRLVRKK